MSKNIYVEEAFCHYRAKLLHGFFFVFVVLE